jgi:thiamine-monophosphate kinase
LFGLTGGQVGVGDDAAVVSLGGSDLVATADLLIDGVHFDTREHAPERIGRKSLAVNLSDLAAMAARPAGALVSLALPRGGAAGCSVDELARRLLEGMQPLAEDFGCPIVGGDTNVHSGPLVVSVTAFGTPTSRGVVRRSGARPGDWLMVTGAGLGGSLAGKHLDFTPRVPEALRLHELADLHAMMDLSDGVSLDLHRMCEASGVGAVVFYAHVIVAEAAMSAATASGRSPIDHALGDGEDFELIFAVSSEAGRDLLTRPRIECGLNWIGEFVAGSRVTLRRSDGSEHPLAARGYEHR